MDKLDISVVFSTHNRADMLREYLEGMCTVDREGLNVEFVVVDNNSKDDTPAVIDSFQDRLPLVHLFEPRPGKNCALNHALDNVELGDIVVFTDDDIVPPRNWLQQIMSVCGEHPEYDVFGGKVELVWPEDVQVPRWARENLGIRSIVFSEHDRGDAIVEYAQGQHPNGPNFWVRGTVLADGTRYDESIGPRPGNKFGMGSEAEFLLRLARRGIEALYTPSVSVGHHVQPSLLSISAASRRAVRYGRGKPHLHGLPDADRLGKHPQIWRLRRMASIGRFLLLAGLARLYPDECRRASKSFEAHLWYGYHREALRMSMVGSRD